MRAQVRSEHQHHQQSHPAPGIKPPGLPDQLPRHVDAQAAVTLLQLTTPIRARCPQARTY
jgi:site-specific recombinase XerC